MESRRYLSAAFIATALLHATLQFSICADFIDPDSYRCEVWKQLDGHQAPIRAVVISSSGRVAASADVNNVLFIWDVRTGNSVFSITAKKLPPVPCTLALSSKGRFLGLIGGEGTATAQLWDLKEKSKLFERKLDNAQAGLVAVIGEKTLAVGDESGRIQLFSDATTDPRTHTVAEGESIGAMTTSPDGKVLYFSTRKSGYVFRWDESALSPAICVTSTYPACYQLAFSNGESQFCAQSDKYLWLLEKGSSEAEITSSKFPMVRDIEFSPDAKYVAVYGGGESLQVRQAGTTVLYVNAGGITTPGTTCAALSLGLQAGDEWLGISGIDNKVQIWRLPRPTGEPVDTAAQFMISIRDLLKNKKYDDLERIIDAARKKDDRFYNGDSRLSSFYSAVSRVLLPGETLNHRLQKIRQWQDASPRSSAALMAEAEVQDALAWQARGGGFANKVTEEAWAEFHERLADARATLDKAKGIGPVDAEFFRLTIDLAKADLKDAAEPLQALTDNLKKSPAFHETYLAMAEFLLPRWHGAPGQLAEFATTVADQVGGDDGLDAYARIVVRVSRYEGPEVFTKSGLSYEKTKAGLQVLRRRYPMADGFLNWQLRLAYAGEDKALAEEILPRFHSRYDTRVLSVEQVMALSQWAKSREVRSGMKAQLHIETGGGPLLGIGFVRNNTCLATFGRDGQLKEWPIQGGAIPSNAQEERAGAAMAVSYDGMFIAAGYVEQSTGKPTFKLLKFNRDTQKWELAREADFGTIRRLAISRHGETIVACGAGNSIYITSAATMDAPRKVDTNAVVEDVAVSADGKRIWTTEASDRVWEWDATGQLVGPSGVCHGAVCSVDGKWYAGVRNKSLHVGSHDFSVSGYSMQLGDPPFNTVAFSPDGTLLAASRGSAVTVMETPTGKTVIGFADDVLQQISVVAISSDGKWIATGGESGVAVIWKFDDFPKPTSK